MENIHQCFNKRLRSNLVLFTVKVSQKMGENHNLNKSYILVKLGKILNLKGTVELNSSYLENQIFSSICLKFYLHDLCCPLFYIMYFLPFYICFYSDLFQYSTPLYIFSAANASLSSFVYLYSVYNSF